MTQSFDEFYRTKKWFLNSEGRGAVKDAYEAGQQSRQAEINGLTIKLNGANERAMSLLNHKNRMVDKMQAEIDEWQLKCDVMYNAFVVADDARKEWHRHYMGVHKKAVELQKRIAEALKILTDWHDQTYRDDSDQLIGEIEDTLKGNQDEK